MKNKSVAESYRHRKVERIVVDVTPPSGFVFKFRKPSPLRFVLANGLPMGLAAQTASVGGDGDQEEILRSLFKIRDQIVELSVEPKIVLKDPADVSPGELSIEELDDEDLNYLVVWVANGGNESDPALATFRPGQGPDALAGARGKKFGVASKRPALDR